MLKKDFCTQSTNRLMVKVGCLTSIAHALFDCFSLAHLKFANNTKLKYNYLDHWFSAAATWFSKTGIIISWEEICSMKVLQRKNKDFKFLFYDLRIDSKVSVKRY